MKGAMEALTNAVAKMSRAMKEKGVQIDEDHSSSGRDNGSINQHRENGEGLGELSCDTQHGSLHTRFSQLDFPHFDEGNLTRWI